MAIKKYKTAKGLRYLVEVYADGERIASRGGFKTKLEAHQWESTAKSLQSKPPALALPEIVTLFLVSREQRVKRNTFIYKNSVLQRFVEYLGKDTIFEEIDRRQVESFLSHIADTISPKSANKYRVELSALYSWAMRDGFASANLARQTEAFAVQKAVKYVPPLQDVKKVLAVAREGFEKDFLLFLLHTAGRISEIRELAWEDVDLERGIVRLWTSKRRGGNREARSLAISPTLREVLERRAAERTGGEHFVFTSPHTGGGFTRQGREVKYLLTRLCRRAEVPAFTAHCLRHFVATHFDDPHRAQKILGHMNLRTTEIYLHDLGVDRGAAAVFEAITNKITNSDDSPKEKGATVFQ